MRPAALLLLCLAPLNAEFLVIEQTFGGLDCASCAGGLASTLKRIRGVASVQMLPGGSAVRLRLDPGNRVRLDRVRDAIKGTGYTPGEARVEVRGRPAGGVFHVGGFEPPYTLALDPPRPAGEADVTLSGTIRPQADPAAAPRLETGR